ncbi:MAG TPA: biotin/lipoyl-containing protein, partial [Solirubrobacteraceae bacterium]|nr:biotin/lipoyl-containing protein [Solirubrobacteraceae bacterium]
MATTTGSFQLVMPAMGDSVAEGTVLEWHKQEGDAVEADETVVEISTDKVDAEVPAPVAGRILKIHAAEGDTVAVGALLAEIATASAGAGNGSSAAAGAPVASPSLGDESGATPAEAAETEAQIHDASEQAAAAVEPNGDGAARIVEIVTPTGGESVTEGTILEWSVKVGQSVRDGETVVEISTDKVDMELPAPASGTITEILAEEGETVTVGQVIARMSVGQSASAPAAPGPAPAAAQPASATPATPQGSPVGSEPQVTANASPIAQRVAAAQGVDLA